MHLPIRTHIILSLTFTCMPSIGPDSYQVFLNGWKVNSFSPTIAKEGQRPVRGHRGLGSEELQVSLESTWMETKPCRAIRAETLTYQPGFLKIDLFLFKRSYFNKKKKRGLTQQGIDFPYHIFIKSYQSWRSLSLPRGLFVQEAELQRNYTQQLCPLKLLKQPRPASSPVLGVGGYRSASLPPAIQAQKDPS